MKLSKADDGMHIFYCPGCEQCHGVNDRWLFNGDYHKPTFSPSILVRGTVPITDEEHELLMAGKHVEPKPFICHSFVKDGSIQYLNDSTHSLAGQTIELLDEEQWWNVEL